MKKILRIIKLQKYRITKIKDFPESVAVGNGMGCSGFIYTTFRVSFDNMLFGNMVDER